MDQNTAVVPFNFESQEIRVVDVDGEPWFVAKDVCDVLDMTNSRVAIQGLDDDEKGVSKVYTLGGEQEMSVISEAGLYTLAIRSNKPQAKPFRKWVTAEVIPSIRKTGSYSMTLPQTYKEALIALVAEIEEKEKVQAQLAITTAEKNDYADRLGEGETWLTVVGIPWIKDYFRVDKTALGMVGKTLTSYSNTHGYEIHRAPDERFGTVNRYHIDMVNLLKHTLDSGVPVLQTYRRRDYRDWETDRKSTRLNSSHSGESRMPSSA